MRKLFLFQKLPNEVKVYFCLLLFMLGGAFPGNAQSKNDIYLVDETSISNVDILEINSRKIRYRNKSGKDLALNTRQVLMAFNGAGDYLVFPQEEEQFEGFLTNKKQVSQVDLIITLSASVIAGRINTEDDFQIDYHDLMHDQSNAKLSVSDIAAIIYKDGTHKLFTSPSQASSILGQLTEKIALNRKLSYHTPEKTKPPAPAVTTAAAEHQPASASTSSASLTASVPKDNMPSTTGESSTVVAPTPEKATTSSLSIDYQMFSRKALQKTKDLGTYLSIISSKNTELVEANKAVELAVGLFISENAQVEVSSKTGRTRHKIRGYLNRLKLLKYDRVEIEWTDISYVSDLKKGVDGNYYGIITLQQRFSGFIDRALVYSDLTEKNIEVVVKGYQKEINGVSQEMWDVFLSDIGVVVTSFE